MTIVVAASDPLPGEDPGVVHPMPPVPCPARAPGPGSPGHCRCLTDPGAPGAGPCPTGDPCRAPLPATAPTPGGSTVGGPAPVGAVLEAADTAADPHPGRRERHPAEAVSLARLRRQMRARGLLQGPGSGSSARAA